MGTRGKLALTAIAAGAVFLMAPATGLAKTKVIGKSSYYAEGGTFFEGGPFQISTTETRWVKNPRKGSIVVRVNGVVDDPASFQDLIWVDGLMQCKQKGQQYDGSANEGGWDHVNPPFKHRIRGFPFGVKKNKPKRCRVLVYASFDPDPPPPYPNGEYPAGTITTKVTWRKK